jgi:hypothetical protein
MGQSNFGTIFITYNKNNWSNFLAMTEFTYNSIMHSSTQQTPLFANHDLHHKCDIQGVHKVLNPRAQD